MTELEQVILRRDRLSHEEFLELIKAARNDINSGMDPEEILYESFGLEPDYVFDLLALCEKAE